MNERWSICLYNYEWIIITSIVLVFLSSFSSSNNNSVWLIDIPNETASNKEGVSLWGVSLLLSSFFISLLRLVSIFGDDGIGKVLYGFITIFFTLEISNSEKKLSSSEHIAFPIEDPFDIEHNPGKSMKLNTPQYDLFLNCMKKEINTLLSGEYLNSFNTNNSHHNFNSSYNSD